MAIDEEACKSAFAGEQVVVARVEPPLAQVVADGEELAVRVVEHREVGMLPHLARDVGVEPEPCEEFDAARAGLPDALGDSRGPEPDGGVLASTGELVEARERAAESLGKPGQARYEREQGSERRIGLRRHGDLDGGIRPRSQRAEEGERLGDGTPHVGERCLERLERRRRDAHVLDFARYSRRTLVRCCVDYACIAPSSPTVSAASASIRVNCEDHSPRLSGSSASSIARASPSSASRNSPTACGGPNPS